MKRTAPNAKGSDRRGRGNPKWMFTDRGQVEGTKMLDLQCIPNILYEIPSIEYFKDIVVVVKNPDGVKFLKKWKEGAIDLGPIVDLAMRAQGYDSDPKEVKLLETKTRDRVRAVVDADILRDSIFDSISELTSDDVRPPYDLVLCSRVIGNNCECYEDAVSVLRRIYSLLRPGGFTIIPEMADSGPWTLPGTDDAYHYWKHTIKDMSEALMSAGFFRHEFKVEKSKEHPNFPSESLYAAIAQRPL